MLNRVDKVFREYQMNVFCNQGLFPKSFYTLSEEEKKQVSIKIKEMRRKQDESTISK